MPDAPRVAVARWEDIPGERLHNYWDRLREAGLEVVDTTGSGGSLKDCAGLVLTGGIDIDPALYGETRRPEVDEVNRPRDEFELALLREALEADLPVLAICRGHELLNVCLGGSLLQHIDSDGHVWHEDEPITSSFHDVTLTAGSKLAAIYGAERIHTNSRHHQAVTPERLAKGLIVTGASEDGIIEGVESPEHRWVVGVQWHPERPEPETPGFAESSRLLWEAFAAAVLGG
jgi:putative glutamine amidotransferase